MMAMEVRQFLARHEPQPEEKGELLIADPLVEPLVDLQIRLLKHIGGIDTPGQATVQSQLHHPLESFAESSEESGQRPFVAGLNRRRSRLSCSLGFSFITSLILPYPRREPNSLQRTRIFLGEG